MFDFQKDSSVTFRGSSISLIATPALAGAWVDISLTGRATKFGRLTTPLSGAMQLKVAGKNIVWNAFDLKQAYAPEPFRDEYDDTLAFHGFISHAQLEAFEKERNGKDFFVEVNASLRVINRDGSFEGWHVNGDAWRMSAQDWVSRLTNCGYKKYLFHELAFPEDSASDADSVYANLRKAREHFDAGLYRECVTDLRKTEEKLRTRRKDKEAITNATRSSQEKESREAMSLDDRTLVLRNSVYNALHTAPHHDEPDSAFTREVAKALLIIVSALVELFPEPQE
ncbi:hypothetical protein [Marinimicrobium sp. C2-29]|uniref:hypothetical protein n=1 Tax=Marinimicrobium sp. C2-29 TaxID=3139825 RepID=UPI0031389031